MRPLEAKRNILFCYSRYPSFTNAVRDYVEAFGRHSEHRIHYYDAELGPPNFDLDPFECIIFNYCFWARGLSGDPQLRRLASRFPGLKIAIFQDEYDYFLWHKSHVAEMGIDTIVTCVPPEHWSDVFSGSPFDTLNLVHALTGYVPESFLRTPAAKPMAERKWMIGYRSRPVHFKYGRLTQEKVLIGNRMKALCAEHGIASNISVDEKDRIYGAEWDQFLRDCRAVLGTESGSNVFDFDGHIKQAVDACLEANPDADFETVHARFLNGIDGRVRMNQVSPRIFEAIAARTALVLFEGEYSGVIRPWEHFIPLRKDFSNAAEVLALVADTKALEELTDRAYEAVIASEKYHYRHYIRRLDDHINEAAPPQKEFEPVYGLVGWKKADREGILPSRERCLIPTDIPLRHMDRLPDPFLWVRCEPKSLQRLAFDKYIRIRTTKAAQTIQDRLRRSSKIYSMVRWCLRLVTGKLAA